VKKLETNLKRVVQEAYVVKREKATDWMKAEVDDETLADIAEKRKRADVVEFTKGKSFVCQVSADPRIIQTKEGPWEVMDVLSQDGDSMLISLGHTVLNRAIREKLQKHGTLVGKVLVILPLGQPEGKRYFDYEVFTWEEYETMKGAQAK